MDFKLFTFKGDSLTEKIEGIRPLPDMKYFHSWGMKYPIDEIYVNVDGSYTMATRELELHKMVFLEKIQGYNKAAIQRLEEISRTVEALKWEDS